MALVVKNLPASTGDARPIPGLGRSPGEGNGNPLIFLTGESHGQRSLAGDSPWSHKESDMTELGTECINCPSSHILPDNGCYLFLNLFERQGKVISFSSECLSSLERPNITSGLLAFWIAFTIYTHNSHHLINFLVMFFLLFYNNSLNIINVIA